MRKNFYFLVMLTMCGLGAAFGQLRVSNGFGQALRITIDGQTSVVQNNCMQNFSSNEQTVSVKCESITGGVSFTTTKDATNGLVVISPSDGQVGRKQTSGPSGQIPIIYKGSISFKIFSEVGRGLEFSATDTINYVNVPKNQDLVIGIGIKKGKDQAIWPYAEIRKRINSRDTEIRITEQDIEMMSSGGTDKEGKKMKIRLTAKDYKIVFTPEASERISLGFNKISRTIDLPIGQFYIKMSCTDAGGMFHSTVFVPKHVVDDENHIDITEQDLKNAVKITW